MNKRGGQSINTFENVQAIHGIGKITENDYDSNGQELNVKQKSEESKGDRSM